MDFWSFAAGAANVIMQLSWPEVGHGVVESKVDSGNLMKHPWKRARTTFQYLAVAILGQCRIAAQSARRSTAHIGTSSPRRKARCSTTHLTASCRCGWPACLFVGLEDTYQLLRGEMTAEQAEQFYRSAWTLGTTLQVTEDQWPPTRTEFDAFWNAACQRVAIDETVRRYLFDLVNLRMINPMLRLPFGHC